MPSRTQWDEFFLRALVDVQCEFARRGITEIQLRPARTHLAAGLACGFAFRATTGMNIEVEQITDRDRAQTQRWHTRDSPHPEPLFSVISETLGPSDGDTLIEINVTQPIGEHVSFWRKHAGSFFHQRFQLFPLGGLSKAAIQNGHYAVKMAHEIEEVLRRARRPDP